MRTLAMMVALLCVAAFVALSEGRAGRLLAAGGFGRVGATSPAAPVEVRGLGRFARERQGRPPKLF